MPDPSPCTSEQPDPQSSTSLAATTAITIRCHPALSFRELQHPAATGYRYRDIQDRDRTND